MDDCSGFIETNLPCPDCGSSDALALNENGNTKCFSCGKYTVHENNKTNMTKEEKQKIADAMDKMQQKYENTDERVSSREEEE